mgnify:CR=1 FL=1|tara:strand:- start:162 stop:383 length:222 start_codon:yes stop_codon:yes gene_type:complete
MKKKKWEVTCIVTMDVKADSDDDALDYAMENVIKHLNNAAWTVEELTKEKEKQWDKIFEEMMNIEENENVNHR